MATDYNPFRLSRPSASLPAWKRSLLSIGVPVAERVLGFKALADEYERVDGEGMSSGTNEIFESLRSRGIMHYSVEKDGMLRIPATGPLIVVANHPYGGLEAMVLLHLLRRVRTDVRFLANYMLRRIKQTEDFCIYVNPFGTSDAASKNMQPLRECMQWLRSGGVLVIFPAGTVSHLHPRRGIVTDPEWSTTVSRIVRRAGAPVLPVYFPGRNSALFQAAGVIHPLLRTVLLPRQMLRGWKKKVDVRIGNLISANRLEDYGTDEELIAFLRLRTYILGNRSIRIREVRRLRLPSKEVSRPLAPIIPPVDPALMEREIASLPKNQRLIDGETLVVLYARARQIPNVLREIGRLREITFRKVQEGTGLPLDLDRFDEHYTHLFIWNCQTKEVVGAYRLGRTDRILKRFGKSGLYTSTLFAYRRALLEQIGPALELGRSFVRPEYQKNYTPLLLLWKGIGHYVVRNPRCRVLFGPVSINNEYDTVSRQLIATFLRANNFLPDLAKLIRARNPMRTKPLIGMDLKTTSVVVKDVNDVTELLREIESTQRTIPVLLRQYLKVGGKLLGFNVDPSFGNVLDGLIFVDLTETQPKLLERYLGREGAARFMEFHFPDRHLSETDEPEPRRTGTG